MQLYWIKDRVKQGRLNEYWGPGYKNLADYFMKNNSPAHHKRMLEIYIRTWVIDRYDESGGNLTFCIARVCEYRGHSWLGLTPSLPGRWASPRRRCGTQPITHHRYKAGYNPLLTATYKCRISNDMLQITCYQFTKWANRAHYIITSWFNSNLSDHQFLAQCASLKISNNSIELELREEQFMSLSKKTMIEKKVKINNEMIEIRHADDYNCTLHDLQLFLDYPDIPEAAKA